MGLLGMRRIDMPTLPELALPGQANTPPGAAWPVLRYRSWNNAFNFEMDKKGDPPPFNDSVQVIREPMGEAQEEYPVAASAPGEWGGLGHSVGPTPSLEERQGLVG